MTSSPRIVVVKLGALGDVVMASTLVAAIRERWPTAELTWVTGQAFAPLVSRWAGVDRVVAVDSARLLRGGWGDRVRALWGLWRQLRGPAYDLGLIAHTDRRYDVLLLGVRVRARRAFRNAHRSTRPGEWMGAGYARLVMDSPMDPPTDGPWPEIAAPPLAQLSLPREALDLAGQAEGAVLLAPGGARNLLRDDPLRRWPIAHWVELARRLRAAGHRVLLVGTEEDRPESNAIMTEVAGVETLVGRTSLMTLVALVARASVVVSHDSGTLHLAMLTRTSAVALFGPTPPEERIPAGLPVIVASAAVGLPCAPCYNGRDYAPCTLNRCLTELSPDRVVSLVQGSLSG